MEKDNLSILFNVEVFYSLEDYNEFMIINPTNYRIFNYDNITPSTMIRATFKVGNHLEKEILLKKADIIKIFSFVKIIYNKKSKNILIFHSENNLPHIILNKINNLETIRTFIKTKLKINKFPLTNYILEESSLKDKGFYKIFLLKPKNSNFINPQITPPFIKNNFSVSNNFNNNFNQKANNDSQTISNLNQRISQLER